MYQLLLLTGGGDAGREVSLSRGLPVDSGLVSDLDDTKSGGLGPSIGGLFAVSTPSLRYLGNSLSCDITPCDLDGLIGWVSLVGSPSSNLR